MEYDESMSYSDLAGEMTRDFEYKTKLLLLDLQIDINKRITLGPKFEKIKPRFNEIEIQALDSWLQTRNDYVHKEIDHFDKQVFILHYKRLNRALDQIAQPKVENVPTPPPPPPPPNPILDNWLIIVIVASMVIVFGSTFNSKQSEPQEVTSTKNIIDNSPKGTQSRSSNIESIHNKTEVGTTDWTPNNSNTSKDWTPSNGNTSTDWTPEASNKELNGQKSTGASSTNGSVRSNGSTNQEQILEDNFMNSDPSWKTKDWNDEKGNQ